MGFAGVVAASVGLVVVTLAANGRWPAVWAALTGNAAQPATTAPPQENGWSNDAGQSGQTTGNAGSWGTPSGPQP